jgi:hypothetical protein
MMKRLTGKATLSALLALAAAASLAFVASAIGARAHKAGGMYIKETASLHRTAKHGFKLYERGNANGTIKGGIALELDVVATNKVVAKVSVYPHGGAIYGGGSAAYHVHGANAEFSGSLSITGGSGSFKGAHGGGLKFAGRIARASDAVTVTLDGTLYK